MAKAKPVRFEGRRPAPKAKTKKTVDRTEFAFGANVKKSRGGRSFGS